MTLNSSEARKYLVEQEDDGQKQQQVSGAFGEQNDLTKEQRVHVENMRKEQE